MGIGFLIVAALLPLESAADTAIMRLADVEDARCAVERTE